MKQQDRCGEVKGNEEITRIFIRINRRASRNLYVLFWIILGVGLLR